MAVQQSLPFGEAEVEIPPRHIEELSRICREDPLGEKVLVAPSLHAGYQVLEALARSGTAWVNLRVETVRTLAHSVIDVELARGGWKLLSRAQALALVEQACAEVLTESSYFGALADRPGLHRSFQRTFDELRAAGLSAEALPESAFSDRRKHRELRDVLLRYTAALGSGRFVDSVEVLRRAAAAVENRNDSGGRTYLLPEYTDLSPLERRFVEKLAGGRLVSIAADPSGAWKAIASRSRLLRAVGEENEIREVFRAIQRDAIPWDDVEILHTDGAVYPPLLWELSREHGIPFTFASGIPASYTRPGQAALAFLDWIGQDFAAGELRQALASGALTLSRLPGGGEAPGARTAARIVREAGIGWGRARHLSCLEKFIQKLEKPDAASRDDDEATDEQRARRAERRKRLLEGARRTRDFLRRALSLAPESLDTPGDLRALANAARTFVAEFARSSDELDGGALTALDSLFAEFADLPPLKLTTREAVERLRDAVAKLAIAADRPRPGRAHTAHYRAGGFSGRRRTFLVGLDESRMPGRDLEDPVLLDEERKRINEAAAGGGTLALGRERPREASAAFWACLGRLRGELSASYSSFDLRSLVQAGEPAPSPAMLELYRCRSARPSADYTDLAKSLPRAAGFTPAAESALDDTEWWLSRLQADQLAAAGQEDVLSAQVRGVYPWLEDGRRAEAARASDEFTGWDGRVSSGTPELDPRSGGEPFSASRVEKLAACPFSYFVRYVLRVEPPEDLESDPTRWLSPLEEGSLLHEVFREFFETITAAGEKPQVARHGELLEKIAARGIAAWSERIPPRSRLAFDCQCEDIRAACRTLLAREEEHCREVTPRYFELAFGRPGRTGRPRSDMESPEPVAIEISPGRSILLRGSIDRVDEACDGSFEVWDYKTGSSWNVREGMGVRGGRQVQPALYAMVLETLLARAGRKGVVSRSGYFFPGRKGEGQRMAIPVDRRETRETLGKLFDLLKEGMFPHALSEKACKYCHYDSVCGGKREASHRAKEKLAAASDPALAAFREMYVEEKD